MMAVPVKLKDIIEGMEFQMDEGSSCLRVRRRSQKVANQAHRESFF